MPKVKLLEVAAAVSDAFLLKARKFTAAVVKDAVACGLEFVAARDRPATRLWLLCSVRRSHLTPVSVRHWRSSGGVPSDGRRKTRRSWQARSAARLPRSLGRWARQSVWPLRTRTGSGSIR